MSVSPIPINLAGGGKFLPLGQLAPKIQFQSGYLFSGDIASDVARVVSNVLGIITVIAGLGFLFYFMFGAINWITSGGDSNKAQAARTTIINALIGLTIAVIAYPIVQILSQLLGVPLAKPQELFDQLVFK